MKDSAVVAIVALTRIERCLQMALSEVGNNELRGYIEDALEFATEAIDKFVPPDHLTNVGIFEATA